MLKEMIRGAGNTCIFFHNSYLSQYVLEGKHPSSTCIKYIPYKNFSVKALLEKEIENNDVGLKMKERITITIDKELLKWLDSKVKARIFANRSHGLEFLLKEKIDEEKESK